MPNELFDPRIDLSETLTENDIAELNEFKLLQIIVNEFLKQLEVPFKKTVSKQKRDKQLCKIISLNFGLTGREYSKEEISLLTELTEERVRQLIVKVSNELTELLEDKHKSYKVNPLLITKIAELNAILFKEKVLSYKNFEGIINSSINLETQLTQSEIKLYLRVFNIVERNSILHHLKDTTFLFFDKEITITEFFNVCYLVYMFLEKNILPTEIEDIIIDVKRAKKNVPSEWIALAANQMEQIEKITSNDKTRFQIKFEHLSNARDMIYRVLYENGKFMKLAQIIKDINHVLNQSEKTKKVTTSVASQLPGDDRFVSQGKSGYWGLTEWNGSNETAFELITNTLTHFNKPLNRNEIFNHILKTRPTLPKRSLDTILYDKTRYTKLNDGTFILNEWKDLYKNRIAVLKKVNNYIKENPIKDQIKQQAILLIEKNSTSELYLKSVVNALCKKFSYSKAAIYKVISENEEFVKSEDNENKKVVTLKETSLSKSKGKTITSVFVSYSWETKEHQGKVISFVDFLRKNGFNADLDIRIMENETAVDFNKLMHTGIRNYNKVIIILSPSYKTKAESFQGGVGKEYRYIINNIESEPQKFVLASFLSITSDLLKQIVPLDFEGKEIVDLKVDEGNKFSKLFSKLINTKRFIFSEVADNTPVVEQVHIKPFSLKN